MADPLSPLSILESDKKNSFPQVGPGGLPIMDETSSLYAEKAGELGVGIQPTFWQKFWSSVALQQQDSPIGYEGQGALTRMRDQFLLENDLENKPGISKLSSDDLNRKFPGLPVPFSEDEYEDVARLKFDENNRRQRMQAWVDRGPETGLGFNISTGAVAGLDPVNLYLGAMIPGGRATTLAGTLALRFGADFGVNIAGELPGVIQRHREQQPLPSVLEFLGGAAEGAALMTPFHAMIDLALKRGTETVAEQPAPIVKQNGESAIKMHETGHQIDMTPSAALQMVRDVGHTPAHVDNVYQYRQLAHPSDVNYYIPMDPETGGIKGMEDLGGGIMGIDNPAAARNQAGIPESVHQGQMVRAELSPDANLVDSDLPVKELFTEGRNKSLDKIRDILGLNDRDFDLYRENIRKLWSEGTVRDLFNSFQEAATQKIRPYNDIPANDFKTLLDGMGYDGIKFTGKVEGAPIDNRIMVFNHEKLTPAEVIDINKADVPQFSVEQLRAESEKAQLPERDRYYDESVKELLKDKGTHNDKKFDVSGFDQRVNEAETAALGNLEERSKLPGNEHLIKEIQAIHDEYQLAQYEIEAVKNLVKCVGENVV